MGGTHPPSGVPRVSSRPFAVQSIKLMSELDPRKESILRAVVFEYVTSAEPVGSELIAHKYELGVKSATVRNELADLADLGYLEQPHTSAGRIPATLATVTSSIG